MKKSIIDSRVIWESQEQKDAVVLAAKDHKSVSSFIREIILKKVKYKRS